MSRKTKISKADDAVKDGEKLFRLTEIDPEYVSLVRAGANRQKQFMVVKEDEVDAEKIIPGLMPTPRTPSKVCPQCGEKLPRPTPDKCPHCGHPLKIAEAEDEIPEDFDLDALEIFLEKFTGSPRNRFGTHSSYKFKGNYASAWKAHFSQHAGGKPDATSTGPIRGTVRRVEMIAATMKPACKLPTTDNIPARAGGESPLSGTFPESPSDYGLTAWDKPKDDADRDGMKLSCSDLEVIKRAALGEIKRRAEDAAADEKKKTDGDSLADANSTGKNDGGNGADGDGTPAEDVEDLASWITEAEDQVEDLSLDSAIQRALDAQADSHASDDGASKEAQEIEDAGTPPVEKVGEEAPGEGELKAEIAKLKTELEESRTELRKSRREITALKAKNARLSKGIGQSSVMLTGEVTAKGTQLNDAENESPSRGAFASGGDIAAAVVEE